MSTSGSTARKLLRQSPSVTRVTCPRLILLPVSERDAMRSDLKPVFAKLHWMQDERIWPNGLRYLWTDAFGVVLLTSLYRETGEQRFLNQAEWVVGEVHRVLGRPVGIRIGEQPDRDGQYYH